MSSPASHDEESKGYTPHMRGVALGILVMGISLAAVIVLWVTIGYQGPDFSTQVMERQQVGLHEQYGLPPPPELSPEMLEVPPSLRSVAQGGGVAQTGETGGGNQTTAAGGGNQTTAAGGGNQTTAAGGGNQTTAAGGGNQTTAAGGGNQTTAAGGGNQTGETAAGGAGGGGATAGGSTINILEGSSIQGSPDYDPEELTVSAGAEVTVVNQDTVLHSATSGTGPQDPESAQQFDTSLINAGESATLSLAQVTPGQYDYYCMVHPYMTGKIVVQ
jgi:plastocyanin